ncbi:MAG: hypothetical protein V4691_03665 [Pseudomonadota bacterium]
MPDIVVDFLKELPRHIGINADDGFSVQKFFSKYIDAGQKNGSLSHQEIFDYVEKQKLSLKTWYKYPNQKDSLAKIKKLERVLSWDFKKEISIQSLLPEVLENVQDRYAAERKNLVALMRKYGYDVISESELTFRFNDKYKPVVPGQYRYIQLRDPSDNSGKKEAAPCLIFYSMPDNCTFYMLQERARNKRQQIN